MVDQSDTHPDGGGTLYVWDDRTILSGLNTPLHKIDLAELAKENNLEIGRRPHMISFNQINTHAIISCVVSGHVLIIEVSTMKMVASIKMSTEGSLSGTSGAHAAIPTSDDKWISVTNFKKLDFIRPFYHNNTFVYEPSWGLDLEPLENPEQPDNWIVCPLFALDHVHEFLTLRGGGFYVVDYSSLPPTIVASYSNSTVLPNGCGGHTDGSSLWFNSGGGWAGAPTVFEIYKIDLTLGFEEPPPVETVFSRGGDVDVHGMVLVNSNSYLWAADRFANTIDIFHTHRDDYRTSSFVIMPQEHFLNDTPNASPDLLVASPDSQLVFSPFRGFNPLSGNVPEIHNAKGNMPGLGIFKVNFGGAGGVFHRLIPVSHIVDGLEMADPHGIASRLHTQIEASTWSEIGVKFEGENGAVGCLFATESGVGSWEGTYHSSNLGEGTFSVVGLSGCGRVTLQQSNCPRCERIEELGTFEGDAYNFSADFELSDVPERIDFLAIAPSNDSCNFILLGDIEQGDQNFCVE